MSRGLEMYFVQPAGRWEETIPVGNGSLGAMIWGGIQEEIMGMNEESLWSGYEREKNNPGAFDGLKKVREYIFEGKCVEAERLIQEKMLGEYNESYMPLGNLHILYRNLKNLQSVKNYVRRLDLETAVATVDFEQGEIYYHREVLATFPGQAVIVKLSASQPVMDIEIFLESELKCSFENGKNCLYFKGRCPEHLDPSYVRKGQEALIWGYRGKRFSGAIRVLEGDGFITVGENKIRIGNSKEIVLAFEAVRPSSLEENYTVIKKAHVEDYRKIYGQTEIYLGEQIKLPTDIRLKNLKEGGEDNGLFSLYFQYGRYLMISSSRKGSLPANLQGIWSWKFQAPWSCNWTTNINLEMNYWPALGCGLEECMEPYFSFVEHLVENGKKTAAIHYHCRGAVHHHNADGWFSTNPVGIGFGEEKGREGCVVWSMWPMGLAWLVQEFFRYYEYSGDEIFLRERAYPVFKETALFLVDWLIEYQGNYVTCPSTSPENRFYTENGQKCSVTMASAMDMELTEEVFKNYLRICEILHIEEKLTNMVRERISRLAPVKIGSYGQILEWYKEYQETEPGHRHMSHLYGLFPSEIWTHNKKMIQAARISLEHRLRYGSGYTGWSCAWIINLFAVLGDGEKAWEYLHTLLVRSTYPNLWDAHEPFQIDGNFGGIAGICNMLVQDRGGKVKLLPALPKQFASGYAKGIQLKGGKAVDIVWEDGRIVESRISDRKTKHITSLKYTAQESLT